ncbi:MAG: serine/threonine protein kinase [Polaromonas sp.]|uniref:serine/threonine-protein kinase n=1 Tax=Polaromonas sp. TaxID=1869339 RepID=UPI00183E3E9B|nr:serine/threonine-protein kinase [Polaromonas sp.]MBA3593636.1 serine/threonine protein kinase [Polaromonas sp.]
MHTTFASAPPGYELDAVLGRGRHGVVYLAHSPQTGRKVAIKLASRGTGGGVSPGFEREFKLHNQAIHPHIVQALDHGATSQQAFLAMELMEGGDLSQLRGPLQPPRALALLAQSASALALLHQQGWVHRDLKPANLLLRGDGSVALSDFGTACPHGQRYPLTAGTLIGTPRYAAPEQQGPGAAQPTADVYSLGVLFYEWLVGKPPYPGTTLTEIICQHMFAPVPRLPRMLEKYQPLLNRMLSKKPEQRWAHGKAVLEQLS